MSSILHLKSGVSYIGNNTLVVMEEMAGGRRLRGMNWFAWGAKRAMQRIAFA